MKRAIVTGGSQGIGAAIAKLLPAHGWHVCSVDIRHPQDAAATPLQNQRLGNDTDATAQLLFLTGDVADDQIRATALTWATHPDVTESALINNAAVSLGGSGFDLDARVLETTLRVNLVAPLLWSTDFAQRAARDARTVQIVNIASVNAFAAETSALPYVVSKHGLLGATRALAVDLAPRGIRVNAVAPGAVASEGHREKLDALIREGKLLPTIPLGRLAAPAEIASVVAFLLGSEAQYMTGATVTVDGGVMAYLRMD